MNDQVMEEISTHDLKLCWDSEGIILIDVRSADAYNGWCEKNERRGGHIPHAKSLPSKWADYLDFLDIVQAKNVDKDKRVVLYGYDKQSVEKVWSRLVRAGYKHIDVYPHFIDDWSADPDLPLEKLDRYQHLVPAWWVKDLISGNNPTDKTNVSFVICHAHYRNPDAYHQGHIPGAIALDTNQLESPETWNRRSSQELKTVLESLGIDRDTTVVLYGRFSFPQSDDPFPASSAGQLAAIRCAFIMLYAGVRDIRVLNGGFQSWIDEDGDISRDPISPVPVDEFGAVIPQHPEIAIDTPEAKDVLSSADKNLVSVRSWPEFIGEVSGYIYIKKKGRIPGAVFGNCGSDAYHMENYRNPDNTAREYYEIEKLWSRAGITPSKFNAFYCGTGWRASEAFLHAWLMGWQQIAVYDGGWFEWSSDEKNAFEAGIPSGLDTGALNVLT